MKTRMFADTEKRVSEIGLGSWQLANAKDWSEMSTADAVALVHQALEEGCTFFDTAPNYGLGNSEEILGQALKGKREDVVISTKFGHHDNGEIDFNPDLLRPSVEKSLKRLQTDYIDSVLLHNPPFELLGGTSEHFEILEQLKQEGKILAYGVSVDTSQEMFEVMRNTNATVIEVMFNIFKQEPLQAFQYAQEKGIALIVKVPLDSGWLSGKYDATSQFSDIRSRWSQQDIHQRSEWLEDVKRVMDPNTSMVHQALQFILSYPEVTTVIPGAKTKEQLHENLTAGYQSMPSETVAVLHKLWREKQTSADLPW